MKVNAGLPRPAVPPSSPTQQRQPPQGTRSAMPLRRHHSAPDVLQQAFRGRDPLASERLLGPLVAANPEPRVDERLASIVNELQRVVPEHRLNAYMDIIHGALQKRRPDCGLSQARAINSAIERELPLDASIKAAVGAGLRAFARTLPAQPLAAPAAPRPRIETEGAAMILGQLKSQMQPRELAHAETAVLKTLESLRGQPRVGGRSTAIAINSAIARALNMTTLPKAWRDAVGRALLAFAAPQVPARALPAQPVRAPAQPAPTSRTNGPAPTPIADGKFRAMQPRLVTAGAEKGKGFRAFWDQHDILSNYSHTPFKADMGGGECDYQFGEQAFQEAKVRMVLKNSTSAADIATCRLALAGIATAKDADTARKAAQAVEALAGFGVGEKRGKEWGRLKGQVMERVLRAKLAGTFGNAIRAALLGTGNDVLLEASEFDAKWGVGLKADDPRIQNSDQWGKWTQGQPYRGREPSNQLGTLWMKLRAEMQGTAP
jgi:ribA/ribD-fused uncharacterized protein